VTTTPSVNCVTTSCRLGDDTPFLSAWCRLRLLVPTSRQLHLVLSTIPSGHEYYQSLEHLRSLEYHATSNSVSTIPPRIDYCSVYSLCVDYSFVSTTSPLVDDNYSLYQHLLEYSVLFKISSMSGLWTADTWAMSADAVMRFGTVDPKRPAVAILAMHPRSLDSSW
jgi:hypothetical protein